MKKVITYGTFDMLHFGHINLLKRAKSLGDYLIVGVTSDLYDLERGKLNVKNSLSERIEAVRATGLADEIIIEEYDGQKILDIKKYNIDIFAIGSDWVGIFDYIKEYCEVVYLERTKGVSSTELRIKDNKCIRLGIIGCGRIAKRFVAESKYVSGINIEGVYNPNLVSAEAFKSEHELNFAEDNIESFFDNIDAVYIASPHGTHYDYIIKSLNAGKHVLCEKPMVLKKQEAIDAYKLAQSKKLVLMEALKTAYCPAFKHLIVLAKCGKIGEIIDVEASLTKLTTGDVREMKKSMDGGSINELSTYVFLPILKILGMNYEKVEFFSFIKNGIDLFTKGIFKYEDATASFKVGLGVKTEGSLVISGTRGYIYVPAPWWKTEYFEIRYENPNNSDKYFYKFKGDGLRYELVSFINSIFYNEKDDLSVNAEESIEFAKLIELYHLNMAENSK